MQTLFIILQIIGDHLTSAQREKIMANPRFKNVKVPPQDQLKKLESRLDISDPTAMEFIYACLTINPEERPSAE